MNTTQNTPEDEYHDRLRARQATLARWNAIDARVSYARLATFGAGALLAVPVMLKAVTGWLLVVPLVLFIALVVYHDRVLRARDAATRAIGFYERGLARIEDRWIGGGEPGDRFRDDHHLYANDLDLFGRGSLFELLSIARTRRGEDTLAAWLKAPAAAVEIRQRQDAVRELTPGLDLREALSIVSADVRARVDRDALVAWAEGPGFLARSGRIIPIVLTAATLTSLLWYAVTGEPTLFQIAIVAQSVAAWAMRHRVDHALHAADGPARDLDILAHLMTRLEREQFASARLTALRHSLGTSGRPASSIIRSLHRLMEMHDWQHNLVFMPIALVLLWGTHLAWAVEAWRARHGAHVRQWLDTVGEFEALSSLSAYRFEHPADPFPDIADGAGPGEFSGEGLGHPLLSAVRMVRNDVHLSGDTRLLVVSGSNMSGKSTLLRTAGINAVLALAGAPVRASALRLTPLDVGATLRIQDSLQEGRSRFYAEITRIRELADTARGPRPLLFLLDELFHGTNSHDRLVGASGVLRALLDAGAIGLITTHDLALTAIADELTPRAANVHFDDWFDGAELRFDYTMKPGPVTRSNALALMRAVGLDVDT